MQSVTPTLPVSNNSIHLNKRTQVTVIQPDQNTRELSPHSAKIMALTPIAPSGTRRRPAKKAGATVDEIFERNEYAQYVSPEGEETHPVLYAVNLIRSRDQFYENCNNEILSLDPRNDQQPIKEFTRQWLFNVGQPLNFNQFMTVTDECIAWSKVANNC
jgi:hypothetical protein